VKITKLSLAAIAVMTLTTSSMAEVTNKLSGGVKIWYETADSDGGGDNGLFHQNASGITHGDAAISIEAKGKAGVLGYGFKYTAVDTLGLENNLVSGRRVSAGEVGSGPKRLGTAHWAEKAFITYQMGKTTAKIGRQHLNTPLAFTEAWNVSANSFDAAVLMNSDIENVTLIAAYVGRGNGGNGLAGAVPKEVGGFSTVQVNGKFQGYVDSGAYAAAVLAKPMKGLGVNAWYYNVQKVADAVWLDANYAIGGVKLGAIYAQMMPKGAGDDTTAFALKAGSKVGPISLFAAYSDISDKGSLPVANTATGFKKTKLPTAGVYNDGFIVASPGAKTFKLKAVYPVGSVKLVAQYISTSNDNDDGTNRPVHNLAGYNTTSIFGKEVDEIDLIAATKIADINLKAIFVNRAFGTNAKDGVVVKSDSNHVRIIAGINF